MEGQGAERDAAETQAENPAFLTSQLITCIGNKRALLGFIGMGLEKAGARLGKGKLRIFDVFSGSGAAARYFKRFASLLMVNDLERYSCLINRCYLSNRDELDLAALEARYRELKNGLREEHLKSGFVRELYAPRDEGRIEKGERVFYTRRNAMYIDTARQLIGEMPEDIQKFFIAPLLSEASVHANTAGVFKGFYKDRETGIGRFGGKNQDALSRITGPIDLPFPVLSSFNAEVMVFNADASSVVKTAPEADLAYLDPPYNQHPYGSNYFMLNLIADYKRPGRVSRVSGIPEGWNRSAYNRGREALPALISLIENLKAPFVLVSFNSEGFISREAMEAALGKFGKLEVLETGYRAFLGSRNLRARNIQVKEYLYLLEKN